MTQSASFRINEPSVISEVIEGEAIILNFESGCYYTLNESGMAIWQDVREGLARNTILDRLGNRYDAPRERLGADLNDTMTLLIAENLIVPVASGPASNASTPAHPDRPYKMPALQ